MKSNENIAAVRGSKLHRLRWMLGLAALIPILALSQARMQRLAVSGHTGSIAVIQLNGKNYVAVDALAQLAGGSVAYRGNQITLSLTTTQENAPAAQPKPGLSRDFLRAAIESMAMVREWHSALAIEIENQFPVTPESLGPYEVQATKALRVAQVSAATEQDREAAQLVANEFQKMKGVSDKYEAQRAAATYINADSLVNDTDNQSLLACAQALGAVAAGTQFSDQTTCR